MKINIDTEQVQKWLKTHLKVVIPLGLCFLSWFAAERGNALEHGISVWWALLSIATGLFGLVTGGAYLVMILDSK